jgi:hypothetical protein
MTRRLGMAAEAAPRLIHLHLRSFAIQGIQNPSERVPLPSRPIMSILFILSKKLRIPGSLPPAGPSGTEGLLE